MVLILSSAGICAAVKTSKIPITIRGQTDITWMTIELLMWGGYVGSILPMTSKRRKAGANNAHSIEMNVIIIAACIPTLRPLVLVLLGRPSASQYRTGASRRSYSQHLRPNGSNILRNPASDQSGGLNRNKAFDSTTELHSMAANKNKPKTIIVDREVRVESGDSTGHADEDMKRVERSWGYDRTREYDRV
ncbi:MAG: hypothetical protein Q9174_002447 [Haloplaca sp. 1 TL-2023]